MIAESAAGNVSRQRQSGRTGEYVLIGKVKRVNLSGSPESVIPLDYR
jgi:hypothetical protein